MFGKLSLEAIPYHEPIVMVTLAMIALGGIAVVGLITYFRKWTYLWTEWLTTVDHKKIGVMYIIVAMIMLIRGFADAIMMRTQLAVATGGDTGYLPPEHYDQIFTAHGVIMIIFMAMPFFTGLMNLAVPLQIGARDVAFPFLNSLSFYLLLAGVLLVNISLGVGEFAKTGWVAYPPLAGIQYSPGVGVDYYIWALQLSGLGTFIGAAMPNRRGLTLFEGLVVLSAIGGIVAAGRHVYILANPAVSCGIDTLQPIVDDLPLAKVWPLAFQVEGFCSTPYPPLLGLSLAQWALLAFVLTAILVPVGIYRNRKRA